jgi:hypothetical protein
MNRCEMRETEQNERWDLLGHEFRVPCSSTVRMFSLVSYTLLELEKRARQAAVQKMLQSHASLKITQ